MLGAKLGTREFDFKLNKTYSFSYKKFQVSWKCVRAQNLFADHLARLSAFLLAFNIHFWGVAWRPEYVASFRLSEISWCVTRTSSHRCLNAFPVTDISFLYTLCAQMQVRVPWTFRGYHFIHLTRYANYKSISFRGKNCKCYHVNVQLRIIFQKR